jgi:hypothetical protein
MNNLLDFLLHGFAAQQAVNQRIEEYHRQQARGMSALVQPFRPYCVNCEDLTDHVHEHDCAHGIPETHMAGSERFICKQCGLVTHAWDEAACHFVFELDRRR